MSYMSRNGSALYAQTRAQGSVEGADRHQLLAMLLDGLVDRINQARGHILHKDIPAKGQAFAKAIAMLNTLRGSLDHSVEPTLTGRLDALYDYITRRLLHAQINDDLRALDECERLIAPIREAWHTIREPYLAELAQAKTPVAVP
ncbi:flagellar export chaperone FliS [Dyella nitratireducens]|uniref:Flagellar secretion chaperone FliS n=1 Tax=Dyella nitratireducens TaxID=1849580 RepID=A0ABQ1FR79_9GAMM|nr:flagellar export chaperone FliS [Dyella nitratireducens]GGA27647.1 flagellar protein FliS [Dyella nitratireducens]GLQ43386.1 flagellar protein FliS [Dyella nitratireducens]